MNPSHSRAASAQPVGVLLRHLIDYAGLFPPATLDMGRAVANYDSYLRSEHSWMLGRFILSAGRLNELEEALQRLPMAATKPWELSVLLGADATTDIERIATVKRGGRAVVESVETKTSAPEDVRRLATLIPRNLSVYCEVALGGRERECIATIAECGYRAKVRTGGETADKLPEARQVIEFIRLCANAGVAFKATAGLHHPLRSVHGLTYEPNSPSGLMHGFLNVFLAAAFLRAGMEPQLAAELLEERSLDKFRFAASGIEWREHRLSIDEVAAARERFSISFGSCSFSEPIDGLQSLGLL